MRLLVTCAPKYSRRRSGATPVTTPATIRPSPPSPLPIMSTKRKRTDAHSPPPSPAAMPRRSGRVAVRGRAGVDDHDLGVLHKEFEGGVERAIRNLQEMESKFQNAVKRQRMAVETSHLSCEVDVPGHSSPRANPPAAPSADADSGRDKEDPNSSEQAPLDAYQAELAHGGAAAPKIKDDGVDRGAKRAPAVNSERLPLPWSGRLGYACLNTYLRTSNPPVFSSRTCRMSSIIDHRHPLQHPTQPEHPTKNRPDKARPADERLGREFVQNLGLTNARDIVKMLRWNHKYGINFMRLSSDLFPFASHGQHGYRLEPFAAETLAEVGKVAAELGHRVTMHPGQFTQLGSPRTEVISAAIRDLEYHAELLSLLRLPAQMDRDAVMILHMGGTYGDKEATLDRFRQNYKALSDSIKQRLVLENDDVAWSVHDLLPICEELNIPFVLDFHHHNIIFDTSIREGTRDIMTLFDRIQATWTRKRIRQKMHYSEQTSGAVTPRERRKHSARVHTLPPCPADMDLMIEAKDKEQAVFELMRSFKLPGWGLFNDVIPYERDDESRKAVMKKPKKSKAKKSKAKKKRRNGDTSAIEEAAEEDDQVEVPERIVSDEDFGMGGPQGRVYWPEGMEEWLKPKKKDANKGKNNDDE